MSIGVYGCVPLFMINALFITFGLLSILKTMDNNLLHKMTLPLLWIGKNSLLIMCLHGVFVIPMLSLVSVFSLNNTISFVAKIGITILTILLCYFAKKIIQTYIPNLIGNK